MKEDKVIQPHHHHHQLLLRRLTVFSGNRLARPISFLLLLVLSYTLGYFSASPPPPPPPLQTPIDHHPTTTVAAQTFPDHNRFSTRCAAMPVPSKLIRQTVINRVFNGSSPYYSFPPPHVAHLLRPKRVKGWGSTGSVFETLIRKVKPRTIIELGTFLGASAIHMAELANRLGLKTQIICVDDFRGWPGFQTRFTDIGSINGDVMLMYQFMQNVVYFNVTDSILPVPYSTGSALEALCELGVFADLIEVDAGHDFHSAWSDINRAYKLLRPGGVMFGHDYFTAADERGVRRAVKLFAQVKGLRIQTDGQHWVIDSAESH
ncbi:hypothetical protein Sjap_005679 [Stephania japonica]|uniref:S-adenosyl-L-methionine-dependent methyltransferase n=1 Tax=Stephania japonica TaxID=461633 RepID=A0AAP0K4Q8_9MAGN